MRVTTSRLLWICAGGTFILVILWCWPSSPDPPPRNVTELQEGVVLSDPSFEVRVVQTLTIPPFLMAVPTANDPCGNVCGAILKKVGYYAPVETTVFRDLLENRCLSQYPPSLVVDVGANLGYFTNYAASFGCRVKVFEPLPRALRYINASLLLNGFGERATVIHAAASDTGGMAYISENCNNTGFSKVTETGTVPVRTVRLDEEIEEEEVLLLKIDVEGFEMNVLDGARALKVRNMIVEMKTNDKERKREFINERIDEGYRVWSYCESYADTPSRWNMDIKKPLRPKEFTRIQHLGPGEWIRCEDVVISRDLSL